MHQYLTNKRHNPNEFDLKESFDGLRGLMSGEEHKYILDLLIERKEFVYGNASGFGYLLDPRFTGAGLSETARREIQMRLLTFSVGLQEGDEPMPEKMAAVGKEYFEFRALMSDLRARNDLELNLVEARSLSVMTFWKNRRENLPLLFDVAQREFALSPSSASSERNFSTLAFIHSKLRNSLGPDKVAWLPYIKTNFQQVGGYEGNMKWVNEMDADELAYVTSGMFSQGEGVFEDDDEEDAGAASFSSVVENAE
jgi:hypothetical protein